MRAAEGWPIALRRGARLYVLRLTTNMVAVAVGCAAGLSAAACGGGAAAGVRRAVGEEGNWRVWGRKGAEEETALFVLARDFFQRPNFLLFLLLLPFLRDILQYCRIMVTIVKMHVCAARREAI